MASRADHKLLKRWNRQRNNKDWDAYLAWMGDPPPHIRKANMHCLAEVEKADGGEGSVRGGGGEARWRRWGGRWGRGRQRRGEGEGAARG